MSVKSTALKNGEPQQARYRSPTAVIPPGHAAGCAVRIMQAIALILLALSTFGNYVTFIGGWDSLGWPVNLLMVGAAAVYQAVFSALQWGMKALRNWPMYTLALIGSAIPSFLTYNAWAGPFLSVHLGVYVTVLIIGLASLGADAIPEWVLVG